MSDPLTGLVKKIDQRLDAAAGKARRTLGAFVIFSSNADGLPALSPMGERRDKQIREMSDKNGLKRVCLGIGAPPEDYEVAKEADVTVVIYSPGRRRNSVQANFALRNGELDETKGDAIVAALSKVLPK